MPLAKSSLASALEDVLTREHASSAAAGQEWARAYVGYAAGAMTGVASVATNATANEGILVGAFSSALAAMTSATAGALMGQGVMTFWQAAVWAGPTATGSTIVPGNFSVSSALAAVFSNVAEASAGEKADILAGVFDAGARQVVVLDIIPGVPPVPVSGPIQ